MPQSWPACLNDCMMMTVSLTIPWVSPMVLLLSHRFFQATRVANLKVDDWGRSLPSRPVVIQTHSSGLGYPKRQIHFVRNLWEVGKMKNLSSFHYQITEWSFETDIRILNHLKDYKTDKKSTHSSWADSFFDLQSKGEKNIIQILHFCLWMMRPEGPW